MKAVNRRQIIQAGAAAAALAGTIPSTIAQAPKGERAVQDATVEVQLPRGRVPLSFIIDDSTCLVNMGHFCMPQFAACYPQRESYKRPWKKWPREIPDAFVRRFGEWCGEHGVKGKYSIVPYPACVGWLDRELPGWSRRALQDSLKLVRDLMLPNWDIHPEMITHTRVIDLKTGRPMAEISPATMENSYPQEKKSVDEMAAYLAYALRILKNCGLPCEGVTTPGGFGNRVKPELSRAAGEAVDDVFDVEIPHYFKYVITGKGSTEPVLEHVRGLKTGRPQFTVNIPAGTGDWFGGWDGVRTPEGHRYAANDGESGRLVDLIKQKQPAIMLCHWPGLYNNGSQIGFRHFQRAIGALEAKYKDQTVWMKLTEIARYWAAKGLTTITRKGSTVTLQAPFDCPDFTLLVKGVSGMPRLRQGTSSVRSEGVDAASKLKAGTHLRKDRAVVTCLNLKKGTTTIDFANG